ncbi:mCG1036951, isoform CRA_a, partial [Mus musculus]
PRAVPASPLYRCGQKRGFFTCSTWSPETAWLLGRAAGHGKFEDHTHSLPLSLTEIVSQDGPESTIFSHISRSHVMLCVIMQTWSLRTSPEYPEYPESFRSAVQASAIAAGPTPSRRREGRKEVTNPFGNQPCYLKGSFSHSTSYSVRVLPRNAGLGPCLKAYNSDRHFC